jgi:hypothetical protein
MKVTVSNVSRTAPPHRTLRNTKLQEYAVEYILTVVPGVDLDTIITTSFRLCFKRLDVHVIGSSFDTKVTITGHM